MEETSSDSDEPHQTATVSEGSEKRASRQSADTAGSAQPDDTVWFLLAVALAGGLGLLHGGRHANVPVLAEPSSILGSELAPAEISLIISVLTLLSVGVTVGLFLAGYWWAGQADVPAAYGRFGGSLLGSVFIGFTVVYALLLVLTASGQLPDGVLPTTREVGRAMLGLVWAPFVGLAGGAIAQYRSATNASWRQRTSNENTPRYAVATGVAGLAGVLHGLAPNLPLFVPFLVTDSSLVELEVTVHEASRIIDVVGGALALFSFVVTIGIFLAGYWWAGQADVPAAYGRFAVVLFVAAFVGHGVGFLPLFLLLSEQPVVVGIGLFAALAVSLLSVPIPGLAGGTIAQYHSIIDII